MNLFDRIFAYWRARGDRMVARDTFRLLNGYTPVWHSWGGEIYESELVRAAIDARARHISKLAISIQGSAKPSLQTKLRLGPNEWQTWGQFLYRLSTILDVQTTALIVPVIDKGGDTTGIYPVLPDTTELVEFKGEPWVRFRFNGGATAAVELNRVGIMTRFQYRNDFFGEGNRALHPTMELVDLQKQGIEEGVKNAASFRFMATLSNFSNEKDLAKERERFTETNLRNGSGGVLLWPNTYKDVKQIDAKPFTVDAEQMKLIETSVFNYFGVSEDILQNKAIGDAWSAFYEGAIEPVSIQLSDVITRMLFSQRERELGSSIMFTANRLQYMSNQDKLNVSTQLIDRGIISLNDAREIWNLPPVDGGDARIIRGEYYNADEKVAGAAEEGNDEQ